MLRGSHPPAARAPGAFPLHLCLVSRPGQGVVRWGLYPDACLWALGRGSRAGAEASCPSTTLTLDVVFSPMDPRPCPALQAHSWGTSAASCGQGFPGQHPGVHRGARGSEGHSVPEDVRVTRRLGRVARGAGPGSAWRQAACCPHPWARGTRRSHWVSPVCSICGARGAGPPPDAGGRLAWAAGVLVGPLPGAQAGARCSRALTRPPSYGLFRAWFESCHRRGAPTAEAGDCDRTPRVRSAWRREQLGCSARCWGTRVGGLPGEEALGEL